MYSGYTTYAGMSHVVKASRPLTVTEVTATVSGPDTAVGGSTIEVAWTGPQGFADDYIAINEPGKDGFNRDAWTKLVARGSAQPLNPASIRVPAIEGSYEIVYGIVPGRRVIARVPIQITRAKASISAPANVKVGEGITVGYTGNGFKGDRIVLVAAGYSDQKMWGVGVNYGFATSTARPGEPSTGAVNSRVTKVAPGEYELRYVTGLQHQVLARAAITITP
jgi:Ca-activated chloride channel family protein